MGSRPGRTVWLVGLVVVVVVLVSIWLDDPASPAVGDGLRVPRDTRLDSSLEAASEDDRVAQPLSLQMDRGAEGAAAAAGQVRLVGVVRDDRGGAAAGARVALLEAAALTPVGRSPADPRREILARGTSGADGRFGLSVPAPLPWPQRREGFLAPEPDALLVTATHDDHASGFVTLVPTEGTVIDVGVVVLQRPARLLGEVRDPHGVPVESPEVQVDVPVDLGDRKPARRLEAGSVDVRVGRGWFEIRGLPPSQVRLRLGSPAHTAVQLGPFQLEAGHDHDLGVLTLTPGHPLSGVVTDARGEPVEGAWVVRAPGGSFDALDERGAEARRQALWLRSITPPARVVFTDAEGRFDIGPCEAGPHALAVGSEFHEPALVRRAEAPGPPLQVRLDASGRVVLEFVDGRGGAAVEPQQVTAHDRDASETRPLLPSEDGLWVLVGASTADVLVRADGFADQSFEVAGATPGEQRTQRLALVAGTRLHGQLTFPDGTPAVGEPTTLTCGVRSLRGHVRAAVQRTDADGRFDFGRLAPGSWTLDSGGVRCVARERAVNLLPDEAERELQIQLQLAGAVQGRVVDVAGEALPAEHVVLDPGRPRSQRAQADGSGSFEFTGLAEGVHRIGLLDDSRHEQVHVAAGAITEIELVDAEDLDMGRLIGRVIAAGVPLHGARVRLLRHVARQSWFPLREVSSDAGGAFVFEDVAPGSHALEVSPPGGGSSDLEPVEVSRGDVIVHDVVLSLQDVSGRVLDEGTEDPVAGATVTLRTGSGVVAGECVTGARGEFRFEAVVKSAYALHAAAPGRAPVTVLLAAGANPAGPLELPRATRVRGRVTTPQGDLPVGRYAIRFDPVVGGRASREVEVVAGGYQIDDLRPGAYRCRLLALSWQEFERSEVERAARDVEFTTGVLRSLDWIVETSP